MLGHLLCSVRDTPSRGLQPDPLRWSTTKKAHRASWTDCAAGLTPRISVCFRPYCRACAFPTHTSKLPFRPQKAAELGQKGGRRNRHTYETPLRQGRQGLRSVPSLFTVGDRTAVNRCQVGVDHSRLGMGSIAKCLAKQALGSICVAKR